MEGEDSFVGLLRLIGAEVRRNWKPTIILTVIFLIGLALRSALYYGPATDKGVTLSGNDPYYHKRVIDYVQTEHRHLLRDPLLGYPVTPSNPRPPVFDWSIAVLGMLGGVLFGSVSGFTNLLTIFYPSLWGALIIVPVYFLTKEFFGRKPALWAALLMAIMPAHIDRSSLGFADHDSFVLFMVVVTFYFFARSLRFLKQEHWVKNYFSFRSIVHGLSMFVRSNRITLGYALMTGISLATIALTWKGFSYVMVILLIYFIIQCIVNSFKHQDSLGIAVIILIAFTIPMLLAYPVYASFHMAQSTWGLKPVYYLYLGTLIIAVAFIPTRDVPWIVLLPSLAIAGYAGYVILNALSPQTANLLLSGAGYFVKTKRYSTIAEAQAPILSRLIISYGPVTFFLAIIGIFLALLRFRKRWMAEELFVVVWAFVSIFMAISAIRFMFNAAPVFAILSGWILYIIIRKTRFDEITRAIRGFAGDLIHGLRRGFKVKHVITTLFVVFLVLVPIGWYAFDAGVPYEKKREYDTKIYDMMPFFLRPEKYSRERSLWYLGAFGQGFPSEYWTTFFKWLSKQDTHYRPEDRPAFLSWWDYGMWCVQIGRHPTVADNFMNGHELAGNVIAAQNETKAIALFLTRIAEVEFRDTGPKGPLFDLFVHYLGEEDARTFVDAIQNPKKYIDYVNAHPEIFGRKDGLRKGNAKYSMCAYLLMQLDMETLVEMLWEVEHLTGSWIRYFAVDSRMFPFSYYNTGIFYAPITLSDHYVSDFLQTMVIADDGNMYTPEEFEKQREIFPDLEVDQFVLQYTDAFYRTMFYKTYIGYSAGDIGMSSDMGIPGMSGQMANYPPFQGWMMNHFRLVYKTVYWSPYNGSQLREHPESWKAYNFDEASKLYDERGGSIDYRSGLGQGVMVLRYYPGAIVSGRLMTSDGVVIPGIRVTVFDKYGIPHYVNTTDEDGTYRVIVPFGNVTITATNGGQLNSLYQTFETTLNKTQLYVTMEQAERERVDRDGDGVYDYLIDMDLIVNSTTVNGTLFWDTDGDEMRGDQEEIIPNATLLFKGTNEIELKTDERGWFETANAIESDYAIFLVVNDTEIDLGITISSNGREPVEKDIGVKGGVIEGVVHDEFGRPVEGELVVIEGMESPGTWKTLTDDEGKYTFEDLLPGPDGEGRYLLSIWKPGYSEVRQVVNVKMGEKTKVDITLKWAHIISGRVGIDVDGDKLTDEPAPYAVVEAISDSTVTTISDSQGRFVLSLPNGTYILRCLYVKSGERYLAYERVSPPAQVDLILTRAYSVGGIAYIDRNGDGEPDREEEMGFATVKISGPYNWTGQTNSEGRYQTYLPTGDYVIEVLGIGPGNETMSMTLPFHVDGNTEVDVPAEVANRVRGRIFWDRNGNNETDLGEALIGSPVQIRSDSHFYTVRPGENGTFDLYLVSDNYTVYAPNCEPVALPQGKDVRVLINPLPTRFVGKVWADDDMNAIMEEDETASSGLKVEIYPLVEGLDGANVTTGPDGKFAIDLLPGWYGIEINSTDDRGELYQYRGDFEIYLGARRQSMDFLAFHLYNLTFTFFRNGTSVSPSMGNVTILPLGMRSPEGIPTERGDRDWSRGGYIAPGNYTVYSKFGEYVNITKIQVKSNTHLAIDLQRGVKYRGKLKVKDRRYEVEDLDIGDVLVTFMDDGGNEVTILTSYNQQQPGYTYEVTLPPGEYRAVANHTHEDDRYVMNEPLASDDLTIVRYFRFRGSAYYDRDGDGRKDRKEGLSGLKILFSGIINETAVTDSDGDYVVYLPFGENGRYNVTVLSEGYGSTKPSRITVTDRRKDLRVTAMNTTLTGVIYFDADGDGDISPGEEVLLEVLEFIPPEKAPERRAFADLYKGGYEVTLVPGDYTVYGRSSKYACLAKVEVMAGISQVRNLSVSPAVRARGTIFYHNMSGDFVFPTGEFTRDITFESEDGVSLRLRRSGSSYDMIVPAGSYTAYGRLKVREYNRSVEYKIDRKIEMTEDGYYDLELEKVDDYSISLDWDGQVKRADPNTTVEYEVIVRNKGDVVGNEISLKKRTAPKGWKVEFTPAVIRLGLDEEREVTVRIKLGEKAESGEQTVKIAAVPTADKSADEDLKLKIHVNHVYGFDLISPEIERGVVAGSFSPVDFVILNQGNGADTFQIEVGEVPEGFTFRLQDPDNKEYNDTDGDGRADTGVREAFMDAPVIVNISAQENATGAFDLPITVISSVGITKTITFHVQVTLPDLRIQNFTVEIEQIDEVNYTAYLNVTLSNQGLIPIDDVGLNFFMDGIPVGSRNDLLEHGRPIGNASISIPVHGIRRLSMILNVTGGRHVFDVFAGLYDYEDLNPEDNEAEVVIYVGEMPEKGGESGVNWSLISGMSVILILLVAFFVYRRKRRRW